MRSMASSVPCSWPSTGSEGKPRAAASFAGVRWCRWSRSAAPAPARASSVDPGSDEPFVGGIVDGGKDAIGRIRAILVGGLEGNGRSQWLRKLERGRVVERVDVDPGEEARRVGRLARLSERARGERQLPAGGRQCASERARDLRRAAAGEEEERRDDAAARTPHRRVAASLVPVCLEVCHRKQFSPVRAPD